MNETEQTLQQKAVSFATSDHYSGAVELLKRSRTTLTTIIGEDEFHTLLNALTLELETSLIQRFIVLVDDIRTGKNLEQNVK